MNDSNTDTIQDLRKAVIPVSVAITVSGVVLLTWWRIAESINAAIEIQMRPVVVQIGMLSNKIDEHRQTDYHRGTTAYVDAQMRRIDERLMRIENKMDTMLSSR